MNKKLFGQDTRQAQLQELYRRAEQGGDLGDVDPALLQAFAADQQLRQQLGRVASGSAPANPATGRAALLVAVARQRSASPAEERRTMIGQFLRARRGLALLAVAGIFAGGAVTVGASGGVTGAATNANEVLATLHVPHKGHGHGHGNSNAGDKPDESGTPKAEGTKRAVEGIPTENSQHHPADDDGVCEQGETIVKTVPSGVAVNVPCQTAKEHGQSGEHGNGQDKADKTPDADKTPEADETPGAEGGVGGEHGNSQGKGDKTPEANDSQGNGHGNSHGNSQGKGDKTPEADETEQSGEGR
jgi:hypothetical protein